ncbi:Type I restriction-modification system, specificity subunit S [Variovorax sp. WDL1]|nr:Type I restriction-modification system, specificity subunit S [Variovorax sp. WDL1]
MPRADWSFIGSVNFPAPARSDQVRIANFLDEKTARIDALIAEKEQLLVSLDDALEAYAFDFASEGLQRKGTSSGRKEGWLARVPAHWSTPKLGYFADVGNGCTPKREVQKYWLDGTMPWVTSTAINDRVIKETAECVTDCALSETGLRVVRPGSAIVGLIGQGPTRGMTARLAIPATVSQNVAYVTSRSPEVSDDYLVVVLTGLYTALRYLSDGSGGAQGAMNCDTLRAFRVPIAPRSEQDAIVQAFIAKKHAIEGLQEHARAHIQRLSEYRSSLISAAVTGLLQVGTVLKGAI